MKRPGSSKATNNDLSFFELKRKIRIDAINHAPNTNVLELYAGAGDLWRGINENRFRIDANNAFSPDYCGDCVTWLKNNDIEKFGLIDVDSWGSPAKALEIIFDKKYIGVVVCTFCSPVLFNPCKILAKSYWGESVYNKVNKKTVLAKGCNELILNYLAKITFLKLEVICHLKSAIFGSKQTYDTEKTGL